MKKTLEIINRLVESNVVLDYAIGGAMGALFYTEAVLTLDLDVFVLFPDDGSLLPLGPVNAKLAEWGYSPDEQARECVAIEGTPVQFLPAWDGLLQDALVHARVFDYEGVSAKVMRAEHLAVICVKTGRAKDKLRVQSLMASDGFDMDDFSTLLARFGLSERFGQWAEP